MKNRITTLLCIAVLVLTGIGTSNAQSLIAYKGKVENGYNFWFYRPANEDGPKPVVIFLHGRSLCGHDMNKVRKYGTIDAIEKGREIDAYVMAPQNPGGSWNSERIMNVLEWVKENNNVDTTRVYVLGMSLGGYGTINLTATYPDKIAAAIALCGGGTKKDYSGLTKVPLWIVHGTADRDVNVRYSDAVVNAMKKFENGTDRLHYDRVKGMNHSVLARVFYLPECYEWLMSHSLTDENREMKPVTYKITNKTLTTAIYRGLNSKKNSNLIKKDDSE